MTTAVYPDYHAAAGESVHHQTQTVHHLDRSLVAACLRYHLTEHLEITRHPLVTDGAHPSATSLLHSHYVILRPRQPADVIEAGASGFLMLAQSVV